MRIHSKFKDYYDITMAHGTDDHIQYIRNKKTMAVQELKAYGGKLQRSSGDDRIWDTIGFCGKTYPVLRMEFAKSMGVTKTHFCYSVRDIDKALLDFDPKGQKLESFHTKYRNVGYWNRDFNATDVQKFLDKWHGSTYLENIFTQHKVPIFTIAQPTVGQKFPRGMVKVVYNDSLREYEFHKVMDAYTAYQEIEMYLGGVLGNGNPEPVPIEDKYLAAGKGFDKWSFRKMPTKRKK